MNRREFTKLSIVGIFGAIAGCIPKKKSLSTADIKTIRDEWLDGGFVVCENGPLKAIDPRKRYAKSLKEWLKKGTDDEIIAAVCGISKGKA